MKHLKLLYLLLFIAMGFACDAKDHRKKPADRPVEPLHELGLEAFPKAWFTFAPASVKCENFRVFMENYQQAFAPDWQLVIDRDCASDAEHMSRKFRLQSGETQVIDLELFIDFSPQTADAQALPSTRAVEEDRKEEEKATMSFDASAWAERWAEWVRKNSMTRQAACEYLKTQGQTCPVVGVQRLDAR